MDNEITFHSCSAEQTAEALNSLLDRGITDQEAAGRLVHWGPNSLAAAKQRSLLAITLYQFRSLIVGLLVAAAGLALALGETVEAVAILVVILINAAIGVATEWKAASALAGLRKQAVSVTRVMRDGAELQIPDQDLVPGDIVLLGAGDRIPADGRVIVQAQLQVDEAALTGESLPVPKSCDAVADHDALLGDRFSMVHMGTAVTDGRARMMVTATGQRTEMGKIGVLIEAVGEQGTPLETKLAELSRALLVIVLALCATIVLIGWLRGIELLYIVEVGISLAIAAVPEGLLAVTTMTLAVGMQRMATMNAFVRRLPAVEALGSTTVICSDKTGTLTRNEMTVRAFEAAGRRVDVIGAGYEATGEFLVDGKSVDLALVADSSEPLGLALRIGALCNDSKVIRAPGGTTIFGDPTEAALIVAAEKAGLDRASLDKTYPRVSELAFSNDTKRMTTVHSTAAGGAIAFVKGAPSAVLDASASIMTSDGVSTMTAAALQRARAANDSLASKALRVLGLAYRDLPDQYGDADFSEGLTFVGLVGMIDPLRDEARETIAVCRTAGIRTIMITGDQQATAGEIARQLGLDVDAAGKPLRSVHARELAGLDMEGWDRVTADASVFARASPEHKLKIINALQRQGHVVAMTGDGVNDAPALRQADIGIAMGIRGTEVAKDASDMVITDDNFATIVGAVEQGRVIVHNILRFIHYLFSCNFAEIVTVFVAILIGWPLPLAVMQILWLNLVTDIFPAMALALEPSAPGVMKRPPRDPNEPLMTPRFGWMIIWQGMLLGACALAAFGTAMHWYGPAGTGLRHAATIAFMTLALAQIFHAFNARSKTRSAFTWLLFSNRWLWAATAICLLLQVATVTVPLLQAVLNTTALTAADWALVTTWSLIPVAVVEIVKLAQRNRRNEDENSAESVVLSKHGERASMTLPSGERA